MTSLYATLRKDAALDWQSFTTHTFVQALAAGTLDRAEYTAWLTQDYLYLIQYTRAYALLIAKSDTVAHMQHASAIVSALLNTEMSLHRAELLHFGITDPQLVDIQPSVETLAYGSYLIDRAHAGDALDLMAVLIPCLAGYGEIGVSIRASLQTPLANHPYQDWIEAYASPGYVTLVADGIAHLQTLFEARGGQARYPGLLAQFRQSVRLETAFWNAGRSQLATS